MKEIHDKAGEPGCIPYFKEILQEVEVTISVNKELILKFVNGNIDEDYVVYILTSQYSLLRADSVFSRILNDLNEDESIKEELFEFNSDELFTTNIQIAFGYYFVMAASHLRIKLNLIKNDWDKFKHIWDTE